MAERDVSPVRMPALVAGVSILVMTVAAVMATDVTITPLVVAGDAAATTQNIVASELAFRVGLFSWLVVLVCDVLAAWGLYLYFKPANASVSLLSAWMRLVYTAILGTAVLNFSQVLVRIDAPRTPQLEAEILLSMEAFDSIWWFGLGVFGVHILLLGYLVITSGYTPRILGWVLVLAFVGYEVINAGQILVPEYAAYEQTIGMVFLIPMMVGEIGFAVWLVIRGFRAQPVIS